MTTTSTARRRRKLAPEDQEHLDNVRELIRRSLAGEHDFRVHLRAAVHIAELYKSARRGEVDFDEWRARWLDDPDIPDDLRSRTLHPACVTPD